jgi:carbonic anhydrase
MSPSLAPVHSAADIQPEWRGTPVGALLAATNLGVAAPVTGQLQLLVSRCFEDQAPLPLPAGFALVVTAPGGVLKRAAFDVSWAVAEAGIRAVAVVGHEGCRLVGLRGRREAFVASLVTGAGWEQAAAEQHFDHWSDLVEVTDPATTALAEARRLRLRYPALTVAALLRGADGRLTQIAG